MKRTIAWAAASIVVISAIMGACGSDVTDTTGSGGGTGGTNTTTSTTHTSSSKASSTTGGMGGSGGGDACSMACGHISACGVGNCSQLPIPLDCGTTQGSCIAACINGASCQELNDAIMTMSGPVFTCVVGCIGGGTGGGGPGAGGAGGGGAQACLQCAQGSPCAQLGIACFMDTSAGGCGEWLNCIQGCGDSACAGACDLQFPNAAAQYQPLYSCLCTSCPTDCAVADPCGQHPPTGAGGAGGGGP